MLSRHVLLRSLSVAVCAVALLWIIPLGDAGPSFATSVAQVKTLGYDPAQNYKLWIYDIEYRRTGDESWLVRIYEPQATGPFPLLLDVPRRRLERTRSYSKRPDRSGASGERHGRGSRRLPPGAPGSLSCLSRGRELRDALAQTPRTRLQG